LIHNAGDALTVIPLTIAFWLRSARAERRAGLFVVAAILFSAGFAAFKAVQRLLHPSTPDHLWAGAIGYLGNFIAAGERLRSAALIADGHHARADATSRWPSSPPPPRSRSAPRSSIP
jgi:divalent metal cation (Fe/Co/Zn/Cd) transporter